VHVLHLQVVAGTSIGARHKARSLTEAEFILSETNFFVYLEIIARQRHKCPVSGEPTSETGKMHSRRIARASLGPFHTAIAILAAGRIESCIQPAVL
jgi:hypothetical protein